MVKKHLTKGDQLQSILADTFKEMESISDLGSATNAQSRRVLDRIEVDHQGNVKATSRQRQGNVEIFLKPFKELGKTIPICNDLTNRCNNVELFIWEVA